MDVMEDYFDIKQDRAKQYSKVHHKKHPIYIEEHDSDTTNDILWEEWMIDKMSFDKWKEINDEIKNETDEKMITQYWHDINKKKYWERHEWRKHKLNDWYWSRFDKIDHDTIHPYNRNVMKKEQKCVIDSVVESS